MIEKAKEKDIERITEIYEAIHTAEEEGRAVVGWARGVYPVRRTAEDGVARGDLFVEKEDGQIVAAGIINQQQVKEYADCPWKQTAEQEEVMVLHTLVVDPDIKGKGFGTAFVKFYEEYALEQGCRFLRMDTQEKNRAARAFYKKLGFTEPGIVSCTFNGIAGVRLVCLEKTIGKKAGASA